jgi:hypothetical protein
MSVQEHTATWLPRPGVGKDDVVLFQVSHLGSEVDDIPQPPILIARRSTHSTSSKSFCLAPERLLGFSRLASINTTQYSLSAARHLAPKSSVSPNRSFDSSHARQTTPIPHQDESLSLKSAEGSTADNSTAEEVRAVRLRHFQKPSTSIRTFRPSTTQGMSSKTNFHIPVGATCIDLTDD